MAIRVGIIGAGWWASYAHIPAIIAHPDAVLHSVHKRDLAAARRVADHFGIERAFSCESKLLDDPDLDAIVISSTPNVHFSQAKAALNAGKHVLLEKPMTITAAEAGELVALAEAKGRHLLISCPWHYTAHGRLAKKLIAQGKLGQIKMISVLMTNPIENLLRGKNTEVTHGSGALLAPDKGSYSDPSIAGGGQIYCQVSHAAAYLTYLTGARVVEVFSRFDNSGSDVDLYNVLSMTLTNGAMVSLASTGVTPTSQRHYEVRLFGTEGVLSLDLWQGTMSVSTFDGTKTDAPPLAEADIYPERAPANNLIDLAKGTAANDSPGTLGHAAMEVIEAACASARSGRPVLTGAA